MLLEIQKIRKAYKLGGGKVHHALHGISLEIEKGEIFGLLGVNGAGKTTLSSIISTLLRPSGGDILWNGKSIYKQLIPFRHILGFCPQKPNLDAALTLEENLIFAGRYFGMKPEAIEKRKHYLIKTFNLKKHAQMNPHMLSGGFKQRFLIARTLMHSPKLVILDEPTVGLDPHVRHQLWEVIQKLKEEGITVILTTHYLDEAEKLCDRICIIDQGNLKLIDTPSNLKKLWKEEKLENVFIKLIEEQAEDD